MGEVAASEVTTVAAATGARRGGLGRGWRRQLHASVGLPKSYRGAAGPLLAVLGIDLEELDGDLLAAAAAQLSRS